MSYILGLCVAQIRAIFRMPQHLANIEDPLTYIHWFRPFRALDLQMGLYHITHSTRNVGCPNADIVSVRRIIRGCHLIPCFGSAPVNASLSRDSVIEHDLMFFLNKYIDFHLFDELESIDLPTTHGIVS
jgi:hypothetical protein